MAYQQINLRNLFIPKPNWVFVDLDWAQIENRLGAILSNETFLLEAFESGKDLYKAVYAQMKSKKYEDVTKTERQAGKKLVLGNNYGMTPIGLAEELGCSVEEAQKWNKIYWDAHPQTNKMKDIKLQEVMRTKEMRTHFGRRRYIDDIDSDDKSDRSSAERKVWNTFIQGTATDILRIGMIRTKKLINESQLEAEIVMPVHDEILVQCNVLTTDPYEVALIMRQAMEIEFLGYKLPAEPEYGWRFGTLTKEFEKLIETAPTEILKEKLRQSKYFSRQETKKEIPKQEQPQPEIKPEIANVIIQDTLNNQTEEIRLTEKDFQLPAIKVELEPKKELNMKLVYDIAHNQSESGYYLYFVRDKQVYKYPKRVSSDAISVLKGHGLTTQTLL